MYQPSLKHLLLVITCLALIAALPACKSKKFVLKDGKTAYDLKLYNQGMEFMIRDFEAEKDFTRKQERAMQIADSYRRNNELANAEAWYKKAVELNAGEQAIYMQGQMQKMQEKYADAIKTFEAYQKQSSGLEGSRQVRQIKEAQDWKNAFTRIQTRPLDKLNTPANDMGLTQFKANQMVFTSSRGEATGDNKDGWTGNDFFDLFVTEKKGNDFSAPQNFSPQLNTAYHESFASFTPQFTEVYFTRCSEDQSKTNQYCHIYYSAFNLGAWSEPIKLELFPDSFNVTDPYITKDGKILLVASDAANGFGGLDLYQFNRTDDGWGLPNNLSGTVNTPGNERSPWLDDKGNLYFASSGLPGMGGLDIFKANKTKISWRDPVNLKYPINSGGDDYAFWIDKYKPNNGDDTILYSGYLTSSRPGGKGGDDIYRFEEKWINLYVLKGRVVEKEYENPENPDSRILGLKPLPKAKVDLKDSRDSLIATVFADTAGRFTFKLDKDRDYKVTGLKNGYFNRTELTTTRGLKSQDSTLITVNVQVELEKIFPTKMLVIPNIYYDYDKSTLRPESMAVLDSITVFFKENPDLTVELGSHTDSRGSDEYNLKLSQARAQSAVDYLISKGVPAETLKAKGYGETLPVNQCTNGAKCSEEEFQLNRRTTFKILSAKINLESIEPEEIRVDPKPEDGNKEEEKK
jgi:peptidoglycan-associated lipoprotein